MNNVSVMKSVQYRQLIGASAIANPAAIAPIGDRNSEAITNVNGAIIEPAIT
jgi:hypothetical protein